MLHWKLRQAGVVLKLNAPNGAMFWHPDHDPEGVTEEVVDATVVDDECVILLGSTPNVLARAIHILFEVTTSVFRLLHLELNVSPGKSEAILLFRGESTTVMRDQWRGSDGQLAIPLDQYGHAGQVLRLVRIYKHLGTMIDANVVAAVNMIERSRAALAAYSPLAIKVFGSDKIETPYK